MDLLSSEDQARLQALKSATRVSNEEYLAEHPELKVLVSSFLASVMQNQPQDPRQAAREYFASEGAEERLKEMVSKLLLERGEPREQDEGRAAAEEATKGFFDSKPEQGS